MSNFHSDYKCRGCGAPVEAFCDCDCAWTKDPARVAAMEIMDDLFDRRGIKWEMHKVDVEILQDIVEKHREIIANHFPPVRISSVWVVP